MTRSPAGNRRAEPTALPSWVKPQLTKLVDQPTDGPKWLHEIKFDGYRMHARLDRGAVQLLTRTRLDWTHKYPAIASAVASLPAREGCVFLTTLKFSRKSWKSCCNGLGRNLS
jgi:ATP-dependent DNA ligase